MPEHKTLTYNWVVVSALEAAQHAAGREAVEESSIYDINSGASEITEVRFSDGTLFRVELYPEHHYSENTTEGARVVLKLFKVVSQ